MFFKIALTSKISKRSPSKINIYQFKLDTAWRSHHPRGCAHCSGRRAASRPTMILHYGYLFVNATIDRNGQTADKDAQVDPNV